MLFLKKHGLWVIYTVFIVLAITFKGAEPLFFSEGPYALGKPIIWLILGLFLAYSLYCHVQENFFKTMSITGKYHWSRQIGVDLYLGVAMFATLVYINEGSLLALAFWIVPLIIFANLITLLYLAMNYDSIVARLLS